MCVCAHVCAVCSFSVGERGWDRIGFSFYGPHIDNPILTSRGKRGSVGKSERVSQNCGWSGRDMISLTIVGCIETS